MARKPQPDDPGTAITSDETWNPKEARRSFAALRLWVQVLIVCGLAAIVIGGFKYGF